jgi:hypothetical protein
MEKVLRESDDGILVYVAPTKALVSQIAAEVYARFSKNLTGSSFYFIVILCQSSERSTRELLERTYT